MTAPTRQTFSRSISDLLSPASELAAIQRKLNHLRRLPEDVQIERVIDLLASDAVTDRVVAVRMLSETDGVTADLRIVRAATAPWQTEAGRERLLEGLAEARVSRPSGRSKLTNTRL
jgi:hypothetical protein